MSADIYTKAFGNKDTWDHALHLINVFHKHELSNEFLTGWVNERAYYCRAEECRKQEENIVGKALSRAGHRRDVQREKQGVALGTPLRKQQKQQQAVNKGNTCNTVSKYTKVGCTALA